MDPDPLINARDRDALETIRQRPINYYYMPWNHTAKPQTYFEGEKNPITSTVVFIVRVYLILKIHLSLCKWPIVVCPFGSSFQQEVTSPWSRALAFLPSRQELERWSAGGAKEAFFSMLWRPFFALLEKKAEREASKKQWMIFKTKNVNNLTK